ncbi:Peptidase inhibitor I78 family protein [compost metagenome]
MRLKTIVSSLALLAVLTGCSSADKPATPESQAKGPGACNAEVVQSLLGQIATADVVKQAHQLSGAQTARVLAPGDVMTMDYNARRLNINIDESEVIEQITCG